MSLPEQRAFLIVIHNDTEILVNAAPGNDVFPSPVSIEQ
jgi:hypothetical protein